MGAMAAKGAIVAKTSIRSIGAMGAILLMGAIGSMTTMGALRPMGTMGALGLIVTFVKKEIWFIFLTVSLSI